jgi:hypothetical protein
MEKQLRGQKAEALLNDGLLKEAMIALEEAYVAAWKKARTAEAREDAHRYVSLLTNFKNHLSSVVLTGALDAKRQAELQGRRFTWK